MKYQIKDLVVDSSANLSRQYITILDDCYVKHLDTPYGIEVFHDKKKVIAGIDNSIQMIGNKNLVYDSSITNDSEEYDVEIDEPIFLLFDQAGLNYIHFFFNFFCKCLCYDSLQNKKMKIGILESFYQSEGDYSFIKEWLDLYYEDVEYVVFKNNVRYKVKSLYLPNGYYSFPEGFGYDKIINAIINTANKIEAVSSEKPGVYISRQDTIKRGWYHNRILVNELELIERLKTELDYDIVELMDLSMVDKIRLFKSYKNILQQSSASNINILFSNINNNNFILTHPLMEGWLGSHSYVFATKAGTNLALLTGGGTLLPELKDPNVTDSNNVPWSVSNLDGLMQMLKF